jgi:hypothetical protein
MQGAPALIQIDPQSNELSNFPELAYRRHRSRFAQFEAQHHHITTWPLRLFSVYKGELRQTIGKPWANWPPSPPIKLDTANNQLTPPKEWVSPPASYAPLPFGVF